MDDKKYIYLVTVGEDMNFRNFAYRDKEKALRKFKEFVKHIIEEEFKSNVETYVDDFERNYNEIIKAKIMIDSCFILFIDEIELR